MKIDFAKKNEKIEHCGCASRLKIAIFVGSFQFSSRFISIDPWKFTNFITGKDQFIFFNDPNAAHCALLKNFRRSFCLLLADLVVLFKKSAAICYFFIPSTNFLCKVNNSDLVCKLTILQMNYAANLMAHYFWNSTLLSAVVRKWCVAPWKMWCLL